MKDNILISIPPSRIIMKVYPKSLVRGQNAIESKQQAIAQLQEVCHVQRSQKQ